MLKNIDFFSNEKGGTFILILMTFLPVLIIITYLGFQLRNEGIAFAESRSDTQAYYAAEMGIERYKNLVIANHDFGDNLSFSKNIGSKTYNIEVVSLRIDSGLASEKIKITSTVSDSNISIEKIISMSRF
ncbi:MAG: hypothetical protein ACM3UU_11205 [Ignavibacteriales bacterium]